MAGEAGLSWAVHRPKGLLVQQHCFLPKRAFRCERTDWERWVAEDVRENLSRIGCDRMQFRRPVIRPGSQFDFHYGPHITGLGRREDTGILKQQALTVLSIWIDAERPTGRLTQAIG